MYAAIKEGMIEGYKKRSLYHTKSIRSSPINQLTTLDVEQLLSQTNEIDAINIALSNLLSRSIRDLHGLIDVQHAEKINILSKMKENGASRNKLIETEKNNDHDNLSHISSELLKILFILSAIKISKIDLLELPHNHNSGDVKGIDDDDDDDYDDGNTNQLLLFTTKIKHWLNIIVQFSILFNCCFHSFRLYTNDIENTIEDHIILLSKDHQKYIELDILKSKFFKTISKLLITSFCDVLSNYKNSSSSNSIIDGDDVMNTIEHVIQKNYEVSSNDWNEVLTYQNNDASVTTYIQQLIPLYKSIIDKWVQHPILTIIEAHELIDKYDINNNITNNNTSVVVDQNTTNTMDTNSAGINIIKSKDDEKQALKDRSQALQKEAQEREKELIESLELKIEKKKIDLQARLAQKREKKEKEKALNTIVNSNSSNTSGINDHQDLNVTNNENKNPETTLLLDNEIELAEKELLDIEVAHNEVKTLINNVDIDKLDVMNADILMAVVNKKVSGMKVEMEDLITIQKDLENKELKSKNDKIMQKHLESEEKLNIAMELKKAKNQQNLQQRLLNRKKKML
jgi:hypothetical protein